MTISTGGNIKEHKSKKGSNVHKVGKYVHVNNTIYISQGTILGNIFATRLENSEAAQWMVQNMKRAKGAISQQFADHGVRGGNVDDCFDLILDEFNSRNDLQFNENHFGLDTGYKLEDYVINRIGYMVRLYRNKINKKPQPLLNAEEAEYYMGQDEDRLESVDRGIEDVEGFIESDEEYWDKLFSKLLFDFNRFLKARDYIQFDVELFIFYMYLDVPDFGEKIELEQHYEVVSNRSGLSVELIEMVTKDLQIGVERRKVDALDILTHLTEIIEGKKYGWLPKRIRDSQNKDDNVQIEEGE